VRTLADIKHTRANAVKPGRREITVANDVNIVHDDITFDSIHRSEARLEEIHATLLLILQQLEIITGDKVE